MTGSSRIVAAKAVFFLATLGALMPRVAISQVTQDNKAVSAVLTSSAYPPVPADASQLWLVPDRATRARVTPLMRNLAQAIRLQADGKYAKALPLVSVNAFASTPLADYAAYYRGVILLRLGRTDEARQVLAQLRAKEPAGYVSEAVRLREVEAAEAQGDHASAVKIYEDLAGRKTASPDAVLMGLAKAALAAGDRAGAARAYTRLYYDYPLSDLSTTAGNEIEPLRDVAPMDAAERYKAEASRAQRLFDSRRYAVAEPAFRSLAAQAATGDDRERFNLRVAECEFYQRRYREARDGAEPYLEHASRKAEAQFFYLSALRELGNEDEYVRLSHKMVEDFPTSSWLEETLNNLASYYIVNNEDEKADEAFRQLYARFPKGHYAQRAAWKIGWWAYKHSRYAETVKMFEDTAIAFPHSDYRPAYLYWAARAHEAMGETELAESRYRLVLTDYRNTYYGRLVAARYRSRKLDAPDIEEVAIVETAQAEHALPANAEQVRFLLALDLVDQAMDELQYAQRTWGDSPIVTATMAWVYNQRGDLRGGITTMKRAYPQYMAAGGEDLPIDIRKVMYPIDYWQSIRKQATSRNLDPYLVAALICQESTFQPGIRSAANAIGLMQMLSPTARHYARSLRIRRFSPTMLTRADTNLRLGVAYFSDLVNRFGGVHFALASYNAGENHVAQWIAERPGISTEEFIDDIPFPETQNYVKRILGSVDDYRILYGDAAAKAQAGFTKKPAPKKAASVKPAVKKTSSKATTKKTSASKKKKTKRAKA